MHSEHRRCKHWIRVQCHCCVTLERHTVWVDQMIWSLVICEHLLVLVKYWSWNALLLLLLILNIVRILMVQM